MEEFQLLLCLPNLMVSDLTVDDASQGRHTGLVHVEGFTIRLQTLLALTIQTVLIGKLEGDTCMVHEITYDTELCVHTCTCTYCT